MFLELHPSNEEQPFLIAVSRILRIVPSVEGASIITGSGDPAIVVRESCDLIRSWLIDAVVNVEGETKRIHISEKALEWAKTPRQKK